VLDSDFELIFSALQKASVRYLVVGGVAVVLHGFPRFTADLDLIVALEPANVHATIGALKELGYRPRAPVAAEDFADAAIRAEWIRDKGLVVFSLWSDQHPTTEVDLFIEEPFAFDEAYARAEIAMLGETRVPIANVDDDAKSAYALHEREQRRAWRKLSHQERLDWLWQAKKFAALAVAAAKRRRAKPIAM
jgi:hypothetical protein